MQKCVDDDNIIFKCVVKQSKTYYIENGIQDSG